MTSLEKWKAVITLAIMFYMWQVSTVVIKGGAICVNCHTSRVVKQAVTAL